MAEVCQEEVLRDVEHGDVATGDRAGWQVTLDPSSVDPVVVSDHRINVVAATSPSRAGSTGSTVSATFHRAL